LRRSSGRGETRESSDCAANRAIVVMVLMSARLVRVVVVADDPRQQASHEIAVGGCVLVAVGYKRVDEVEREMDRDERVEAHRNHAEPCGDTPYSSPVWPHRSPFPSPRRSQRKVGAAAVLVHSRLLRALGGRDYSCRGGGETSAVESRDIERLLTGAQRLCAARGARLTPVRRRVLELILRADQPIGAYALLAELQGERGKLGPPTVYRALDFLLAHKLVHKVESVSAYIACEDVEHPHESQFMICDDCGATEEIQDAAIVESLRRLGEDRGYVVGRQVIEARGLCPACRAAHR
jgi:Fur family transcriptional regulator, zinc uptake regulator